MEGILVLEVASVFLHHNGVDHQEKLMGKTRKLLIQSAARSSGADRYTSYAMIAFEKCGKQVHKTIQYWCRCNTAWMFEEI